jgi:hypothetical protein
VLHDLLKHVSAIGQLHHDTGGEQRDLPQTLGGFVEECFFVLDDVGVLDGGQNAHFINGILQLFVTELIKFDLFESVELVVSQSLDLVDIRVGAIS